MIAVQADDRVIKMIAEVGTDKNPEVMAARILLLTVLQHHQPASYYRISALERVFPQADIRKAIDYLLMGMSQNKEVSKELLEKQRTVCADYIKRRFTDK